MKRWKIWIDTGGTFTDCMALDPQGNLRRVKVLSSSSLRGTVVRWLDPDRLQIDQHWQAPADFVRGFSFSILDSGHDPVKVSGFDPERSVLELAGSWPDTNRENRSFEVQSSWEAPVLAARLATGTGPGAPIPAVELRLATTKGTNALLERTGSKPVLFVTEGFRDLLKIGDQKRPELFALEIRKPPPIYRRVVEVPERMDASGNPLKELDIGSLENRMRELEKGGPAAVCLMNSYLNPEHEEKVASFVHESGFSHVSVSSQLNPFVKILPRAQTTVVNAYLSPVLDRYLKSVEEDGIPEGSLRIMTSAGGLVTSERFHPKDSLLSGPAGGVVGAAAAGSRSGFSKVISFDMGGTSTDVARYDGGFDYVFEHEVGDARLSAPALSIETVAAGGGSVCAFDGYKLTVGPESAGADPGPACYGSGGPLTLTDVNLLLGRLEPDNFGIPVSPDAAESRFREVHDRIKEARGESGGRAGILEGFLTIANERMADAIRKISLRKGYDPAEYALVAFGGAGAQHACAIAKQLGAEHILVPPDAGLLSATGLGHAVVEQFAERQILRSLPETEKVLPGLLNELEERAREKLAAEGVSPEQSRIRRRLIFLRLEGQESSLEVEFDRDTDLHQAFKKIYRKRYGHWISGREIEVESIRVVASGEELDPGLYEPVREAQECAPLFRKKTLFGGRDLETAVYRRRDLAAGRDLRGPALILDPHSTIVVEPGWSASVLESGSIHLQAIEDETADHAGKHRSEAVALELFTNRFTSIAEEMGEMLQRTALSVNVKERLDFSCALLNAKGQLVVNAPHIPVHLGALGLCVRRLMDAVEIGPGDVIVTNHPAFGGSHLPDVTVVTPVFAEDSLIGFAASRAHHAEIGGARPGSMPPDASSLTEEGVVIPPMHLVESGEERWEEIRSLLTSASYPTRSIEENVADLQAAVAANQRGVRSLQQLVDSHGLDRVEKYMDQLRRHAAQKMRSTLRSLPGGTYRTSERLDDGTPLEAEIRIEGTKIAFNFEGTGAVHPGNLNATPAIVNSVIIYLLRLLVDEPLPLNEGLLEPVSIRLPRCLLNPEFPDDPESCPAVVGGNVETSQRLVDLLLKPFNRIACSQGTMNNVLFGTETYGYYETIGGGTGAGPDFDGADAVHHHMTNTAGTDPEILERRYPVRLERYAIRTDSGGSGARNGGNGIERELIFLEPVSLSVLTQHRLEKPYGLEGGGPGARGRQWIIRKEGTREELQPIDGRELEAGERFVIQTPGGGGYGNRPS